MKIQILKRTLLKNIPSASGCEIINGLIYIIGDDSCYLYCLDHNLNLIEKIKLFNTDLDQQLRIPKNNKADLETLTTLNINNNTYLLSLGSGSTFLREKGYLIKLPNKYNNKHYVQEVDLHNLYTFLSSNYEIVGNGILNIEGAATTDNTIILLQRGSLNSKNVALVFDLQEFIVFLLENNERIPFPKIVEFQLPILNGVKAGFSGICFFNELLFFTATLEDTNNAIDDGKILGSFISVINNSNLTLKSTLNEPIIDIAMVQIFQNNNMLAGKIESISIYEKDTDDVFIGIAVTDDDLGNSELLMIEIAL